MTRAVKVARDRKELEKAEKGKTSMSVSMGLVDAYDLYLTHWQCTG